MRTELVQFMMAPSREGGWQVFAAPLGLLSLQMVTTVNSVACGNGFSCPPLGNASKTECCDTDCVYEVNGCCTSFEDSLCDTGEAVADALKLWYAFCSLALVCLSVLLSINFFLGSCLSICLVNVFCQLASPFATFGVCLAVEGLCLLASASLPVPLPAHVYLLSCLPPVCLSLSFCVSTSSLCIVFYLSMSVSVTRCLCLSLDICSCYSSSLIKAFTDCR